MKRLFFVALLCIAAGCATGSGAKGKAPEAKNASTPEAAPAVSVDPRPDVTLTVAAPTILGEFLPVLADKVGGSLVIMNGLQNFPVDVHTWRRTPFDRVVKDLAAPANLKVQETPAYYFLYLTGYESLESVTLEGRIDPGFGAITASIGFGYGTPLFEAFAYMAGSLGVTLVCDQLIGDAEAGALNLAESPLSVCIEALLKSARVPADAFEVESTPEYVFIRAKSNPSRNTLLNPLELSEAQTAFLDKKVSVDMPSIPLNISRVDKLKNALPALSQQLGVEVAAGAGLEELPVSPAVFKDARVRTVLDLLIRQWPVAEFGYRVEGNRVVIQRVAK